MLVTNSNNKKTLTLFCVILFSFVIALSNNSNVYAQKNATSKNSQNRQLTVAENAGVRLISLCEKGYVTLEFGEPNTYMKVEPKLWNSMMHRQKVELCKMALTFLQEYKKVKAINIDYLIVLDMTTNGGIARGYLDNNRIEINR